MQTSVTFSFPHDKSATALRLFVKILWLLLINSVYWCIFDIVHCYKIAVSLLQMCWLHFDFMWSISSWLFITSILSRDRKGIWTVKSCFAAESRESQLSWNWVCIYSLCHVFHLCAVACRYCSICVCNDICQAGHVLVFICWLDGWRWWS